MIDLIERIERFVDRPDADDLDDLALAAFALQYERVTPFRRLCEARGVDPSTVDDWRTIPPVPVLAFKTMALHAAPAREVFRSSGTTGGPRSVHHHPFPDLYRRVIDATFPRYCLGGGARPPMLSLVPSRRQVPDSSLAFMVDHVLERFASAATVAFEPSGVDAEGAGRWCRDREADGRAGLVLTTAFALVQWLEAGDGAYRLPPGTVVLETGGLKGRTREIARSELLELLERRLGVPPDRVVREYGMSELTSQFYTEVLTGGDADVFVGPPWLRARILDPETLAEAPAGETGLVAVFDLANVGSAVHVLTQDLGVAEPRGFRLAGRAAGAELRGCSLLAEEIERTGR